MSAGVSIVGNTILQESTAPGLYLTEDLVRAFIASLRQEGKTRETLAGYQRNLRSLQSSLPDGLLDRETLRDWQNSLIQQGYSIRTVNRCVSAANSFLNFVGRRDLQISTFKELDNAVHPELTRAEYTRLLQTAKLLDKEQAYLLIKVFGTMDLPLHDLNKLTVEAAAEGWVRLSSKRRLRIPACLREELLAYARRHGYGSGPIFLSKAGECLSRTHVTAKIQRLADDARVPREKCNPRCLRKLCADTQQGIWANVELLAEQAYDRLLETEQLTVGWNEGVRG